MKKTQIVNVPLTKELRCGLRAGDRVLISGAIYTARDMAHKRLVEAIKKERKLPFDLHNQIIYYTGPTPAKKGKIIGSCGPTTSLRMDKYTPMLLGAGLGGVIGKGQRSADVISALRKYKSVYFAAIGGAGALLSQKVKSKKFVAYKDLGCEAIYKLELKEFPVVVAVDAYGRSIYGRNFKYR
ncbi:MAG: Fe-S-containing hydro-lyase [bacterium]|nr:Fe-S-containing hydro-lyase [bacterium]